MIIEESYDLRFHASEPCNIGKFNKGHNRQIKEPEHRFWWISWWICHNHRIIGS